MTPTTVVADAESFSNLGVASALRDCRSFLPSTDVSTLQDNSLVLWLEPSRALKYRELGFVIAGYSYRCGPYFSEESAWPRDDTAGLYRLVGLLRWQIDTGRQRFDKGTHGVALKRPAPGLYRHFHFFGLEIEANEQRHRRRHDVELVVLGSCHRRKPLET